MSDENDDLSDQNDKPASVDYKVGYKKPPPGFVKGQPSANPKGRPRKAPRKKPPSPFVDEFDNRLEGGKESD
jgi:hypothetical protein